MLTQSLSSEENERPLLHFINAVQKIMDISSLFQSKVGTKKALPDNKIKETTPFENYWCVTLSSMKMVEEDA